MLRENSFGFVKAEVNADGWVIPPSTEVRTQLGAIAYD